jgi:hypothetical protein
LRSAASALSELQAYRTRIIFDDAEELVIDLYNIVVAKRTIRPRRTPARASGEFQRWIARYCARTEMFGSGNGATGRRDACGQTHLQRFRYFSASKKGIVPVAAEDVV